MATEPPADDELRRAARAARREAADEGPEPQETDRAREALRHHDETLREDHEREDDA